MTALAFAVAAAGIGFAIWAFGRTPESPQPRPASTVENGKIAYVVHGEGGNEIHVMDPDGSNAAFLVKGRDPSWSPDGAQIAFRTGNPEKGGGQETRINLIDADGTNLRTFSPDVLGEASGEAGPPVFLPDGTRLAFDTLGGIYVMDTDGTSWSALPGTRASLPATTSNRPGRRTGRSLRSSFSAMGGTTASGW